MPSVESRAVKGLGLLRSVGVKITRDQLMRLNTAVYAEAMAWLLDGEGPPCRAPGDELVKLGLADLTGKITTFGWRTWAVVMFFNPGDAK